MSNLAAWQRIAVLGLNNHSGELPVPEQVASVYPDNSKKDSVQKFLDLATLTYGSSSFATLPEQDEFDELPALPPESSTTISDELAKQFESQDNRYVWQGLLFALFQKGYHLPERWLQRCLQASHNDKSLPALLRGVMSEKLRWLAALNPEWQTILGTDDKLERLPLPLQLAYLNKQPPEILLEQITEHWKAATPTEAAHWLTYCHQFDAESLQPLVELTRKERSRKTQRVLLRLFAKHNIDETRSQAGTLLATFLCSKSKLLRNSVEIDLPEELTDELTALKINDFNYSGLNPPKPVLRLGQLMVLAGTEGIAACLNKPVIQAYKALAGSSFSKEFAPFLLEAALWSQDEEAIKTWCQLYKGKKCPELELAAFVIGIDKATVNYLLIQLVATKNKLWLSSDFFKWLYQHNLSLNPACSDVFVKYLLMELKYGLYNQHGILIKMLCLLSADVQEKLKKELEERLGNFTEELSVVLRFHHALNNL